MSDDILAVQDGAVLRITFNRPERGNAFSEEMIAPIAELIESAEKKAKLVVIRGAGNDFCAGRVPSPSPDDPLERRRWGDPVFRCYGAFRRSAIPTIAVVTGRAFGFGCAVAALCDITLADETAQFRLPEMANGIMPANAMSALIDSLPRKAIGYLAYTSETIDAHAAQRAGLVSTVVPAGGLDAHLARITAAMVAMPVAALSGVKEYLAAALDMPTGGGGRIRPQPPCHGQCGGRA